MSDGGNQCKLNLIKEIKEVLAMTVQPLVDTLDSIRPTALFEWTFAILVANFTVQFYRLVAQFTTFLFDIFKLSYGVDLFWPLTTDDLRPYSHYFITQNEIIFKLVEGLILTIIAFYGARCLLDNSIIGLAINLFMFLVHSALSILGCMFVHDNKVGILSLEFLLWLTTLIIEIAAVILTGAFISYFGFLAGYVR